MVELRAMTRKSLKCARSVMTSSVIPSARRLACSSPPKLSNGRPANDGRGTKPSGFAPEEMPAVGTNRDEHGAPRGYEGKPQVAVQLRRLFRHHGLRLGGHAHLQ